MELFDLRSRSFPPIKCVVFYKSAPFQMDTGKMQSYTTKHYNIYFCIIYCTVIITIRVSYDKIHEILKIHKIRCAATGGNGGICPPPTLRSRGTSYVLVPLHFYHNIYFDWLVPPTYTPSFQRPYIRYHSI